MIEIRDVLEQTLADVVETGIPDDLRAVAFAKAFDMRAGATAAPVRGGARAAPTAPAVGDDPLANVAARLGLDLGTVGEVFSVHDGELELITPAGKLSRRTATATKEIALLVAGGRQAAGLEEWTSSDVIRAVCQDFKRYDSPNFAKTLREMEDVFNFRRESERKLSVRLARPGWDRAGAAVQRLGGGE